MQQIKNESNAELVIKTTEEIIQSINIKIEQITKVMHCNNISEETAEQAKEGQKCYQDTEGNKNKIGRRGTMRELGQ